MANPTGSAQKPAYLASLNALSPRLPSHMLNRCPPSCLCHTSFEATSDPRSALNTPQVDTADPLIDCAATYAETKHAQNNAFGCATVVTLVLKPPANTVNVPNVHNAATAVFLPLLNFTNMLRREMLNGDPPLTSSDVLHYALDEGLNMIFEEGLESARRRKGPKAMGLQPLPQTPHAPAPPQLPSRPRQVSSPPTPGRPLGRNTASCGGQTGGLGAQTGPYGRPGSYAHLELALSTRGMTLADLGLRADVGAVQKTCREIGRALPTPRGQHARGVSAEGSPWIEPPYRRCWLDPPPGELQILRRFPTGSPRARQRCRRGPPPRGPQAGVGYIGPEAQDRRRGVLSSAAAGA
jgi:hypothetical protein